MSACETHPSRPALGACTRCGRFVCADCRVLAPEGGRFACRTCALTAPAALPGPQPTHSLPDLPSRPSIAALAGPLGLYLCAVSMAVVGPPLGSLAAGVLVLAAMIHGRSVWRRHRRQRLEARALGVFRALRAPAVTHADLVRDFALHPDEAEQVLGWLAARELLVPDWERLDGPVVYRRGDP